jgi:hypothetical protein
VRRKTGGRGGREDHISMFASIQSTVSPLTHNEMCTRQLVYEHFDIEAIAMKGRG